MRQTKTLMSMLVTLEIADDLAVEESFETVFAYFKYVDENFSFYKDTSEVTRINKGQLAEEDYSKDMKEIFALCEATKVQTNGYFNILHNGKYNPSGLVKGWAIYNAARLLDKRGVKNFYLDAGGDIEIRGKNGRGLRWRIGIRNPFNIKEIIKVVCLNNQGIATSGIYERGRHIYNPKDKNNPAAEIMSLTVIGSNVYEADRFATAAFAMGKKGIDFIEDLKGFEGYMVDQEGLATFTSGFEKYTVKI